MLNRRIRFAVRLIAALVVAAVLALSASPAAAAGLMIVPGGLCMH
jgi:hypothetical protein